MGIICSTALVADGEDTAMVRASLLDSKGELAVEANDEIVFSVKSGDGKLWVSCPGHCTAATTAFADN